MPRKRRANGTRRCDLAQPAGQVAVDLIQWDRLRAGRGQFAEATAFLKRRPDWPGLPYLRQRSEATIEPDAAPHDVIAFFSDHSAEDREGRFATGAGAQ